MAVRTLVILVGLALGVRGDIRARDPGLEDEPGTVPGQGGWDRVIPGVFGTHRRSGTPGHGHGHHGSPQTGPALHPQGHGPPLTGPEHHLLAHRTPSEGPARHPQAHGPSFAPQGVPEEAPPTGEARPHHPARMGNWCTFVEQRVVTVAVSCGTEKYTIKSQSPCPSGTPDCQLVMYKLSARPVYKQQKKTVTFLLWRCCSGYRGDDCEDRDRDGHTADPGNPTVGSGLPGPSATRRTAERLLSQPAGDQTWEQNDFQGPGGPPFDRLRPNTEPSAAAFTSVSQRDLSALDLKPGTDHDPADYADYYITQDHKHERDHDHDHDPDHGTDHGTDAEDYTDYYDHSPDPTGQGGVDVTPSTSPSPDAPQLPSLPLLMDALMAQLGPVLDGFNRTLERLSHEVGGLSQDLARLKREREGRGGASGGPGPGAGEGGDFEAKLEESFFQLDQVREELRQQRVALEDRMHSQQAMLHYNLTNFKTDTDVKIKRSQKMIQVNLHSLNTSLTEVKQKQEQLEEEVQSGGAHHSPHVEGPVVWDAIRRLDVQVVNNTVKVNALLEDLDLTTENIRDLQRGFRGLEGRIDQTGRDSQIQFMETGLEVEAAKVVVLDRIQELASNLTLQDEQLKDMDSDMDYLYTQLYKINATSTDCDCKALKTGLAKLERDVANVSKSVEENRQGLEEFVEGQDRWEVGGDTLVEDLKQGLLQVKESLAFEQDKSRVLHLNVSQLLASHLVSQQEIRGLQESDQRKAAEMKRLASSFSSLLKDAIRHTEVLEVLLGEEVLEFKERPAPAQQEYSIPVLRDRIQQTLVQIKHQNVSLTLLWRAAQEADVAAEDQALGSSEPASRGLRRRSGGPQEEDIPDSLMGDRPDYSVSDFWSLGKEVEDLNAKVSRLEEQRCVACCNCTKNAAPGGPAEELQSEVSSLRRGLEDHLRVFKDVFSDMDGLAGSAGTLELDKLWALVKRKEEKKRRRQQKEKKAEKRESHGGQKVSLRSRRDASPETAGLTEIRDAPLVFLASTSEGATQTGAVVFERALLNHGEMYSAETGVFRAPAAGVYLFALTVDFGPGPSLARLKRGEATAATLRRGPGELAGPLSRLCLLELEGGEQLRLELSEGTVQRGNAADNTFAGLLLFRNT
ncbi:multimerin-2a isoform X2 [Anguilla rostrata]|uniref:multimerin-2a isoform X2 n=1 Tax=Anguilla rostrata TaxID=7938 RepID=UPI0030D19D34